MTENGPVVTVETVTPELAAEWLVGNTHNRSMKDAAVQRYAADMLAGNWDLNGESIKFNGDGRLLDGQNRLQAIMVSRIPIRSVIVRGVEVESQETMDVGVQRKLADVLKLRGEVSTIDLASVIVQMWRYERDPRGMGVSAGPSVHVALAVLDRHPGLRESVRAADNVRKAIGFRTSVSGPLHYITSTIDAEDGEAFWDRLNTGANLEGDDPILLLRNLILADRGGGQHRPKITKVRLWALCVKAWNAYRDGRKVKLLVWRPGGANPESYPVPE